MRQREQRCKIIISLSVISGDICCLLQAKHCLKSDQIHWFSARDMLTRPGKAWKAGVDITLYILCSILAGLV